LNNKEDYLFLIIINIQNRFYDINNIFYNSRYVIKESDNIKIIKKTKR